MTDLQERIMELVDEIDEICKKQGLRYILGEKTAGTAKESGSFLGDTYEFSIHMPLYDAVRLREYTAKHLSDSRVVESWTDNGSLKRLMFRYVDKGSLLIDESRGEYYRFPGIAVTIFIARTVKPEKRIFACERYLMKANTLGKEPDDYASSLGLKGLLKSIKDSEGNEFAKRQYGKFGRDGLASYVETANEKVQSKNGKDYWHLTLKGKWLQFPDKLFDDVKRIPFEGRMLPVANRFEDYMKIAVGKNWKDRCLQVYSSVSKNNAIAECNLPFEEYLEFTKDDPVSLEMIINERIQYKRWKEKDYNKLAEKVRLDFRKVRASQIRIDMWYDLRPQRDALAKAYEKGDVDTLATLLKDYLVNTDKFYKDKLGFFIDETLLDYADLVWKSQGKSDYRQKVYDLVPDQWKKMDLEAHLMQYL